MSVLQQVQPLRQTINLSKFAQPVAASMYRIMFEPYPHKFCDVVCTCCRFDRTNHPQGLELVFGISVGDKKGRGTDVLAKVSAAECRNTHENTRVRMYV